MTDSNERDHLAAKHMRNRRERIEAIKRRVEYIKTHDPDDWGEQQNRLINAQLEAARQSGIDVDHRKRVERAGDNYPPEQQIADR